MRKNLPELRQRIGTLRELEKWIELPMRVLAFVWLVLVIVEMVWGDLEVLAVFGTAIWALFIAEFALRFAIAPAKLRFLRKNAITALALAVPALRIFRAFRFVRAARAVRGIRLVSVVGTANRGMNALRLSMGRRGVGYVLLLTLLVVLLGAAGMHALEGEAGAGLNGYAEAIWWTAMLIMSLGTDFWPRTVEGRILCVLLAFYGFGVFGYITATLASFFVGQDAQAGSGEALGEKLAAIRTDIAALREELRTVAGRASGEPADTPFKAAPHGQDPPR